MKTTSRSFVRWGAVGLILTIIGISGVPDDLETWGRWIQSLLTTMNHDIARLALVSFGVLICVAAVASAVFSDTTLRRRILDAVYTETLSNLEFRGAKPSHTLWKITGTAPSFTQEKCEIDGQQNALKIHGDDYTMNHEAGNLSTVELVEFIGKFLERSAIYIRVEAVAPNNETVELWLKVKRGWAEAQQVSWHEWQVAVDPDRIEGDWESIKIPVFRKFAETFGRVGYKMRSVTGLRLRQKMTIVNVRFARCPKHKFALRALLFLIRRPS